MDFRYRYVPFGTKFEPVDGCRPHDCSDAHLLFRNEIAADVGGVFWGHPVDGLIPVVDHHFSREDQFPSAAAAVLHSAVRVHEWAESAVQSKEVVLVTHEYPDFDAFASLYLIRSLVGDWVEIPTKDLGLAPDSWRSLTPEEVPPYGRARIDWFRTPAMEVDENTRWLVLFACVASMVDNCKPFPCGRQNSAPAVLYAALERKRGFLRNGAMLFFDHLRNAIVQRGRNPLIDAIFLADEEFAPEVELLAREEPAYQRDLRRARQAIVTVPAYSGSFASYYSARAERKLLGPDGKLDGIHIETDGVPEIADGIYLRDPESILFKDLVRLDLANSSLGQGFTFTAIAYSRGRPNGRVNQSDYYFALDPEKAGRRTLYPIWARLEDLELRSLSEADRIEIAKLEPRREFADRAPNPPGLLHDPWFDAANSWTTLVATPFRGTSIGPAGTAVDLSDDPVARLVRNQLELSVYSGQVKVIDHPTGGNAIVSHASVGDAHILLPEPVVGHFRFCEVPLIGHLDIRSPLLTSQIGEFLWSILHSHSDRPTDFLERHLTRDNEVIGVWSRRGIAVAYLPASAERVEATKDQFGKLVPLLAELPRETSANDQGSLDRAEAILSQIAEQRQKLSMPESILAFRRFVDAIGFHETLGTVQEVLSARVARTTERQGQKIAAATSASIDAVKQGQEKVEFLEILFVTLYSIEILHIVLGLIADNRRWEAGIACAFGLSIAVIVWVGLLSRGHDKVERKKHRKIWQPLQFVPALTIIVLLLCGLLTLSDQLAARFQHLVNPPVHVVEQPANCSTSPTPDKK